MGGGNKDIYYYWFFLKSHFKKQIASIVIDKKISNYDSRGHEYKSWSYKKMLIEGIERLKVPLPSKEMMSSFNSFCEPFWKTQQDLEERLYKLKESIKEARRKIKHLI